MDVAEVYREGTHLYRKIGDGASAAHSESTMEYLLDLLQFISLRIVVEGDSSVEIR